LDFTSWSLPPQQIDSDWGGGVAKKSIYHYLIVLPINLLHIPVDQIIDYPGVLLGHIDAGMTQHF